MQGNKTNHEILNDLKKYTDHMVMQPDEYTFCRRFVLALQEPLRQEVLKQGLNPEKSTIGQLYKLANVIEEAMRYNQGTVREPVFLILHPCCRGSMLCLRGTCICICLNEAPPRENLYEKDKAINLIHFRLKKPFYAANTCS